MVLVEPPPQAGRSASRSAAGFWAAAAQAADELRPDDAQLGVEVLAAVGGFVGQGRAVVRRPALEDVEDVDVLALQRAGLDDLVEQLAGAAHERLALAVFVGPGASPKKHEPGLRIADAEDRLRSRAGQFGTACRRPPRRATAARAAVGVADRRRSAGLLTAAFSRPGRCVHSPAGNSAASSAASFGNRVVDCRAGRLCRAAWRPWP